MANLIATEQYAKNIGGVNTSYTPSLGCTKSRAIALGCNVGGTYSDNQLVCQKDLSKASTTKYSLRNVSSDYLTNVKIQAGNCIFTGNYILQQYLIEVLGLYLLMEVLQVIIWFILLLILLLIRIH